MGIFDFFSKGLIFATVEKIEKKIKASECSVYFSQNDTKLVTEYKDFEITILASALTAITLELNLEDTACRKDIQTIYIGKTANFLRKFIYNEFKVFDLDVSQFDESKRELMVALKVHTLFDDYYKELQQSFRYGSIFEFWEYESPEFDDNTGESEVGENRLYKFLWNVFLAYEGYDFEDFELPAILHKTFLDLSEEELDLMKKFVNELADYENQ